MDHEKDPLLTREDALRAENCFLKLKLGLEHGMQMSEMSTLPPEMENEWLRSVYAFEQQFRNAKRVKLYDYVGRPEFKTWDALSPEQVREERQRLEVIMENNNVHLECLCEYDDAVIYRFITEELFHCEMDDIRIPGMTMHYTYEEFYPNHDYDLRRDTSDFIHAIYARQWDNDFDEMKIHDLVCWSGAWLNKNGIGTVIKTFQEQHHPLCVERFDIRKVTITDEERKAVIDAIICVTGNATAGEPVRYEGPAHFGFVRPEKYWSIDRFEVPGFNESLLR